MNLRINRRSVLIILLIGIISCNPKKKELDEKVRDEQTKVANKTKFVNTKNGLILRAKATRNSEKLSLAEFQESVEILERGTEMETISGKTDVWYYVSFKGKKGYLFGGFLQDSYPEEKSEFDGKYIYSADSSYYIEIEGKNFKTFYEECESTGTIEGTYNVNDNRLTFQGSYANGTAARPVTFTFEDGKLKSEGDNYFLLCIGRNGGHYAKE